MSKAGIRLCGHGHLWALTHHGWLLLGEDKPMISSPHVSCTVPS
jgi:hypothetical protein